jgi:Flp pilus assembly pilin Flp
MSQLISMIKMYLHADQIDRGASAVEYAIVVALIASFVVATVVLLGNEVLGLFQLACARINGNVTCT